MNQDEKMIETWYIPREVNNPVIIRASSPFLPFLSRFLAENNRES